MFKTLTFENPLNQYREKVTAWVYLWAFIVGPVWYLWRGLPFWAAYYMIATWATIALGGGYGWIWLLSCVLFAASSRHVLTLSYLRRGWKLVE